MFGHETIEMKIARLESDRDSQIASICAIKRRLFNSLERDRDDSKPCGMNPGGETDLFDIRGASCEIEAAVKQIDHINHLLSEFRLLAKTPVTDPILKEIIETT